MLNHATEILAGFGLTPWEWALVALSAALVGFAKSGIGGASMPAIPILAAIFGAKASVGILLPILCFGDVFAVTWYHRHAEWQHVGRLLPWSLAGLAAGVAVFLADAVTDAIFQRLLGAIVLVVVGLMAWRERREEELEVPTAWWFSALLGLGAGFTTMVGNAAGPIMILYLLSMRLPKFAFIGTAAWYFAIVNLLKVPLHVLFTGKITAQTFLLDLTMIPAVALGAGLGILTVRKLPEKPFRAILLLLTAAAAVKLLV